MLTFKLAYTAFVLLVAVIWWRHYSWRNFLWFSDIAFIGAVLARLEPLRMARAAEVTAAAQAMVGVAALFIAPDQPEGVILSGILAGAWFASGQLFRVAARDQQALTRPAG